MSVAPEVNMDHLILCWNPLSCQQPTMGVLETALNLSRENCSAAQWAMSHQHAPLIREVVVEGPQCPICGGQHIYRIVYALWKNPVQLYIDIIFDRVPLAGGGHYLLVRTREGIRANLVSFERVDAEV